ncbi:oligosaccharide flippase family protein [Solwaraspora sp. WMMA2056]|uniref:lipopolysaccharide biosynthesis protein n=1 Tax=Solwaraspora sp. WMMA2056 TaxID=3015161 RepID=UPI00259B8F75|nr:oligosaccharide flippase family protein [Solwaraspora sp. WMMA2056]WJK43296.1 oligosaccharide flippase family protein [Solwaraspora sp. WMMA2056]
MAGRPPVIRSRRSTLALLTASSAVQLGSNMVAALLASAVLGPHGRGLMVLGVSTAGIVPLLAGLGTGPQLRAAYPSTPTGTRRRDLVASYTWWSVAAVGIAAVAAVAVSAACAPLIDPGLADPRYLLALSVLTCGYVAHTQLPDSWYAAGGFRSGSLWAITTTVGGTVGLLVAVAVAPAVWTLLAGQGLGMLAAVTVQVTRLRAAGLLSFAPPTRGDLSALLRHGVRALGLTLGLALTLRLDRYVLGAITGAATVGVYSVASTLGQLPRMVPTAIGQLVNRDAALTDRPLRPVRTVTTTAVAVVAAGAVTVGLGWLVIVPLLGPQFAGARPLLLVLVVAEIAFVPYAVASRALLGAGRMGAVGAFGLLWSAAAVLLFVVAVGLWGALGAALACVTLYAGLSVSSWWLLTRRLTRRPAREPAEARPRPAPLTRV